MALRERSFVRMSAIFAISLQSAELRRRLYLEENRRKSLVTQVRAVASEKSVSHLTSRSLGRRGTFL